MPMQICYRSLVLFLLISFSGVIRSQDRQDSAAMEIRKRITAAHQLVPGTHVYLVPPAGFVKSQTFTGLNKEGTDFIRITETKESFGIQGENDCNTREITRDGVRIIDQREIPLNGYPAHYILWQNDPAFMLINICLGDTGFTASVQARFKAYDEKSLESVKTSLFSIVYDRLRTVIPFEETFFIMDYASGPLHPAKLGPGNYYFAPKENNTTEQGQSHATLSWFSINQTTTAIGIADDILKKEHPANIDRALIRRIGTRLIHGHDALEREIYIPENGGKILLYQGIILFTDKAILLEGYAYERFGENLETFRDMLSSVRSKE
jgi:hypothetical protein